MTIPLDLNIVRIVPAGDAALLIEFQQTIDPRINARAIALAERLRRRCGAAIRDAVVGYATLTVYFDPLVVDGDWMEAEAQDTASTMDDVSVAEGAVVEVPVCYGGDFGPDIGDVARFGGCSTEDVITLHAGTSYRVYMVGFVPGFAYLAVVDDRIAAPRRTAPRGAVPPGSVAIAARQTGVYPSVTPGGWNIIGRTPLKPYDPSRRRPFLFQAGDTVKFRPVSRDEYRPDPVELDIVAEHSARALAVIRPGMLTTIQDLGRWGHQADGVPVAGPMDVYSHRLANQLVGNSENAAALEITLIGPELSAQGDLLCAIAGAEFAILVGGHAVHHTGAFRVPAGANIRFGERRAGVRATLAVRGGIVVDAFFGSRATSVLSQMGAFGGRPLVAGDLLPVGDERRFDDAASSAYPMTMPRGGARLRVIPGPHVASFTDAAYDAFLSSRYTVTPNSNRMGYQLEGRPLAHVRGADLLSDATPCGSIQVPGSGQPILLMADRQTTGGYPKMATVISADLPLAGQLAPGDWVEFTACTRAAAVEALRQQERRLTGRLR